VTRSAIATATLAVGLATGSCTAADVGRPEDADSVTRNEPSGEASRLIVRIEGLRSTRGSVRIAAFDSAETFPDTGAVRTHSAPARGEPTYDLGELPAGRYAVVAIHDENDNGTLDQGLFGIPEEGAGASSGAQGYFSPPDFDEAAFVLAAPRTETTIEMIYW
jgi:uncharacterized protein (DUF2141 family)